MRLIIDLYFMLKFFMQWTIYLERLGLEPGVSRKEIQQAYRSSAKKNHPDMFPEQFRHAACGGLRMIRKFRVSVIEHMHIFGVNS